MIIGISGKIGSGKDTTLNIIKFLLIRDFMKIDKNLNTFKAFLEYSQMPNSYENRKNTINRISGINIVPHLETVRFADTLKDWVCQLLGCTREQLEDREFKEKELGEEWELFRVRGSLGHFDKLYANREDAWKRYNEFSEGNADFYHIKLTPRLLLQLLGTDCGRDIIHPNIWVNALLSKYKDTNYPNWIIPDVRFPNELKALQAKDAFLIRLNVPYKNIENEPESETALDNVDIHEFNLIINNYGTLEDLFNSIKANFSEIRYHIMTNANLDL